MTTTCRRAIAHTILVLLALTALGCTTTIKNPEKFERARDLISDEVPEAAVAALPEQVPPSAIESRLYAEIHSGASRDVLILASTVPPEDATRIAAEARSRALWTQPGWTFNESRFFYQPVWQHVFPNVPRGADLPGNYEAFMLYQLEGEWGSTQGMQAEGTNAGVLVDEKSGSVIWWVYHRNVWFN